MAGTSITSCTNFFDATDPSVDCGNAADLRSQDGEHPLLNTAKTLLTPSGLKGLSKNVEMLGYQVDAYRGTIDEETANCNIAKGVAALGHVAVDKWYYSQLASALQGKKMDLSVPSLDMALLIGGFASRNFCETGALNGLYHSATLFGGEGGSGPQNLMWGIEWKGDADFYLLGSDRRFRLNWEIFTYARITELSDVSGPNSAFADIATDKYESVEVEWEEEQDSSTFQLLSGKVVGTFIPLPTSLGDNGLPVIYYEPFDPPDAKVVWAPRLGQLYIRLGSNAPLGREIKVRMFTKRLKTSLTPASFKTGDINKFTKADLSDSTKGIFEYVTSLGNEDKYGQYALTKKEQITYAASLMRASWKKYDISNAGLYDALKAGDLKKFHTKELDEANCALSNGEFFVAARLYGFNMRLLYGFLGASQGHPNGYYTPGHAWTEYFDARLEELVSLDVTPLMDENMNKDVDIEPFKIKLAKIKAIDKTNVNGHEQLAKYFEELDSLQGDARYEKMMQIAALVPTMTAESDMFKLRGTAKLGNFRLDIEGDDKTAYVTVFEREARGRDEKKIGTFGVYGSRDKLEKTLRDPTLAINSVHGLKDYLLSVEAMERIGKGVDFPRHPNLIRNWDMPSDAEEAGPVASRTFEAEFLGYAVRYNEYEDRLVMTVKVDGQAGTVWNRDGLTNKVFVDRAFGQISLDKLVQLDFYPAKAKKGTPELPGLYYNPETGLLLPDLLPFYRDRKSYSLSWQFVDGSYHIVGKTMHSPSIDLGPQYKSLWEEQEKEKARVTDIISHYSFEIVAPELAADIASILKSPGAQYIDKSAFKSKWKDVLMKGYKLRVKKGGEERMLDVIGSDSVGKIGEVKDADGKALTMDELLKAEFYYVSVPKPEGMYDIRTDFYFDPVHGIAFIRDRDLPLVKDRSGRVFRLELHGYNLRPIEIDEQFVEIKGADSVRVNFAVKLVNEAYRTFEGRDVDPKNEKDVNLLKLALVSAIQDHPTGLHYTNGQSSEDVKWLLHAVYLIRQARKLGILNQDIEIDSNWLDHQGTCTNDFDEVYFYRYKCPQKVPITKHLPKLGLFIESELKQDAIVIALERMDLSTGERKIWEGLKYDYGTAESSADHRYREESPIF